MAQQQRSRRCPDGAASAVDQSEELRADGLQLMVNEMKGLLVELKEELRGAVNQAA